MDKGLIVIMLFLLIPIANMFSSQSRSIENPRFRIQQEEAAKILWYKYISVAEGASERGIKAITTLEDGEEKVYVIGEVTDGARQWLILKLNEDGDIEFNITYPENGSSYARPYDILVGSDGYIYGVGQIDKKNISVIRIYPNGTYEVIFNSKIYFNGKEIGTISQLPDIYGGATIIGDSIYIATSASSLLHGGFDVDILLIKIKLNGSIEWVKAVGTEHTDYGLSIFVDSKDNIYVLGARKDTGYNTTFYVISPEGDIDTYSSALNITNIGYDIYVDSDGYIYIGGGISSDGKNRAILMKYYGGTLLINTTVGDNRTESLIYSISKYGHHIYAVGYIKGRKTEMEDLALFRFTLTGQLQWNVTLPANATDIGYGLCVSEMGNIYVVGKTESFGAKGGDLIIIKYEIPTFVTTVKGAGPLYIAATGTLVLISLIPIIITVILIKRKGEKI